MPTLEEILKTANLVSEFYTQLTRNGIPPELAVLLTRDYFNNWLRWEDDDDDNNMELTPSPWYPQASKEFPGLDEVIRTGYK